MKKTLLAAVICIAVYFTADAQTKGTNTLGLGINVNSIKQEAGSAVLETKASSYSLGYGRFIKDNLRFGVDGALIHSETSGPGNATDIDGYSGGISLQKYFPVFNKFYAFGGGKASYSHTKSENNVPSSPTTKTNSYFLNAYGGVSYFLSKHFALEADLLSGGVSYISSENSASTEKTRSTNFNVSTSGNITNLGFRVYFLF